MGGERAQHRDTAAAARQEHDARGGRGLVELFGKLVAVQFGGDVEIVDTGCDARLHQRLGSTHERPRAVQQRTNAIERRVRRSDVIDREQAVFDAEFRGQRDELCLVLLAARDHHLDASVFRVGGDHPAGISSGTVDHQFRHVGNSSFYASPPPRRSYPVAAACIPDRPGLDRLPPRSSSNAARSCSLLGPAARVGYEGA
jgi:hypothetical protein